MKIIYGVAVSGSGDMAALPKVPEFPLLEIPGTLCADPGVCQKRAFHGKKLMINNSSDIRFFRSLPDAGSGVRQDFYRLFANRCRIAASLGAVAASLAPDLESALSGQEQVKFRQTLGMCFGIAEKFRLPLNLELRIPGAAAVKPEAFLNFKKSLLYPLRTMCVLHPHEPGALDAMEKFSAVCRFECDMCRIVFDAASGNYITANLLRKVLSMLRQAGAALPVVIFDPGSGAEAHTFTELKNLVAEVTR